MTPSMNSCIRSFASTLIIIVGVGCATIDAGPGFDAVRKEAGGRTEHELIWVRGAADDDLVRRRIQSILNTGAISLEDVTQIALVNNRRLQAIFDRIGVANARTVAAGQLGNPVLDAEWKFLEGGGGDILELSLTQGFLDLMLIPLRKQIAEVEYERARTETLAAVVDLIGDTREAFIEYQSAEQVAELLRAVTASRYAAYETARRLRDAGNITRLELLLAQAPYEEAKIELAAADSMVLARREELNGLMGLWGDAPEWQAAAPPVDLEAFDITPHRFEAEAIRASLELRIAALEMTALGRRLGLNRADSVAPDAHAGIAAEKEADDAWALGPAISIPIPIFNRGRAATAEGEALLAASYDDYYALATELRGQARAAYIRASTLYEAARYLREIVLPLRVEVVQRTQEQYNAMQIGVFQLLDAKEDEIVTARRYIEATREYRLARSKIQRFLDGRATTRRFGLGLVDPSLDARGGPAAGASSTNGGH